MNSSLGYIFNESNSCTISYLIIDLLTRPDLDLLILYSIRAYYRLTYFVQYWTYTLLPLGIMPLTFPALSLHLPAVLSSDRLARPAYVGRTTFVSYIVK